MASTHRTMNSTQKRIVDGEQRFESLVEDLESVSEDIRVFGPIFVDDLGQRLSVGDVGGWVAGGSRQAFFEADELIGLTRPFKGILDEDTECEVPKLVHRSG